MRVLRTHLGTAFYPAVHGVQHCHAALRATLVTYAVILGVLVAAYAPVLTTNYFFYDDYFQLAMGRVPLQRVLPVYLAGYRPGFALWLRLATNSDNTVLASAWVRCVGVVGLTLLCYAFYVWAQRCGWGRISALCLAIFAGTTPAFQSVIGYASTVVSTYCALLSALSAMLVLAVWTAERSSALQRCIAIGCGAMLITLAMGTYQPPTMFCWVIVGMAWCAPTCADWRRFLRACGAFLVTFLLGMSGTFVVAKILLATLETPPSGRTALLSNASDLLEKLAWFGSQVMPDAFVRILWGWGFLLPRSTAVWVTGVFLLLTLLIPLLRRDRQPGWQQCVVQAAGVPVLLCLAFFPFMLIKEQGYLTLYFTALQPLLVVLFVSATGYIWMQVTPWVAASLRQKALPAGIGLLALVSVLTCNRNMVQVYVFPNLVEYRYVKNLLSRADLRHVSHVHVKGHLHFSGVLLYGEYLVSVVLNELSPGHTVRITSSSDEIPVFMFDEMLDRNPNLLRPLYTLTPHGYHALRTDITAEEREAVHKYFITMSDLYRQEGALVVDVGALRGIVGIWGGVL